MNISNYIRQQISKRKNKNTIESVKKFYPRSYSVDELEKEVDNFGNSSPNSHLGASYYARASLGLTELERRNNRWFGALSLLTSILALIFSILAVKYSAEQTRFAEIQSTSERINQARSINRAVEFCKTAPLESTDSGLFNIETGIPAPCSVVLKQYKN